MKNIEINNIEYEIIKDYKDAFNKDEVIIKMTDYFDTYDYILGDYAYGKLRLKGFCNENNKQLNKINDYNMIENYIKKDCAYDCKYFILKKINDKV